jgi:TatD DNase family protein
MTVYRTEGDLQSEDWPALVDTHCHLDLEPLYSRLPEVLADARHAGVTRFVIPGVHPEGWDRMRRLAQEHEEVFAAFGIHPMHADTVDETTLSRLSGYMALGVAVGEIGMDPNYAVALDLQEQVFRDQLRLAVSCGLPVLVHCRKVFQRLLVILKEEEVWRVGGVMHAFSGSPEMANEFIKLGFAISISGTVTWERAVRPVRLAREIPLDSLVLETDAPDLTPYPFRKQPNNPALLKEVLLAVARIRGIHPDYVAQVTKNTSHRILKLPTIS